MKPLWPYDEVKFTMSGDGSKFIVEAPWLKAGFSFSSEQQPMLEELIRKQQTGTLGGPDLPVLNQVLEPLHTYPFSYTLPMAKPDVSFEPKLDDSLLVGLTLQELLKATYSSLSFEENGECENLMASLGRSEFEWDECAAMGFAALGDKVHPESLFSVARRYHLLDVMEMDDGTNIFAEIMKLEPDEFRQAAAVLIRQNHYVTQKCQESLAPALNIAGPARSKVEEFMSEENGHDQILGVAMKALVAEPAIVPVTTMTKTLMHLLKFAAGRNLLAFAMIVDGFERSSYQETDPLAQLLSHGGFEKAARFVNRHKEINDAGGHENIALGFLNDMAPVSHDYALEALRLAELTSLISTHVTRAAFKLASVGPILAPISRC